MRVQLRARRTSVIFASGDGGVACGFVNDQADFISKIQPHPAWPVPTFGLHINLGPLAPNL